MTQKISPVICDGCGADITATGNSVDYRLALKTERPVAWFVAEGETCGAVTDMMVYPAIRQTHHFCNDLDCMRAWLAGPDAVEERARKREERWERINRKVAAT